MKPLTIGAIAFLTYFGNKLIDWGIEKAYDLTFESAIQKLRAKSPEKIATLEAAAETLSLALTDREDIDIAVLVSEVEKTAQQDPEFKAAVEALGTEAQQNSELEDAIRELTTALKNQPRNTQNVSKIADTVEKIGVANIGSTIKNQTINNNNDNRKIQINRGNSTGWQIEVNGGTLNLNPPR